MARNGRRTGAGARHGRLRRSSSLANAAKVLLTTVLVFAVSGVSVAAYAILGVVNDAQTIELMPPAEGGANAVGAGTQSLDGAFSILLVGTDSRAGSILDDGEEGELNDVNILLHVPADHKSATIMSFPRDLMVPIPSCLSEDGQYATPAMSEQQLNTAQSYGGLACVALTISELTGIDIPYAAMVNFDGVINISHALGGVEVCLAQPIDDEMTGLHLPEGDQVLVGLDALQFLRSRYGVGDGSDVARISNQMVFMSALLRQMRSAETLGNPIKVYGLAKAGFNSLTMSSSMASIEFMQSLAATVVNIDLDRINFVQYPSVPHPEQPGRLAPNTYVADQVIDVVLSGEPFQVQSRGGAAIDAGSEEPLPVEGEAEGVETGEVPPTIILLPEGVTGQSAADMTCSAGRTQY